MRRMRDVARRLARRAGFWTLALVASMTGCVPAVGSAAAVRADRHCVAYLVDTGRIETAGVGCPRPDHQLEVIDRRGGVLLVCRCAP